MLWVQLQDGACGMRISNQEQDRARDIFWPAYAPKIRHLIGSKQPVLVAALADLEQVLILSAAPSHVDCIDLNPMPAKRRSVVLGECQQATFGCRIRHAEGRPAPCLN